LLFKVDISKAFDSVAWPFLLQIMEFIGFQVAWREWVATILGSSSAKGMMNGSPGQHICHECELHQGHPLSPMLFLLVMEVLSALIRRADEWQLLQGLGIHNIPHRASLYADDLILFIRPCAPDLQVMRLIFSLFEGASGLGCNLAKCQIAPIQCTPEDIEPAHHSSLAR
jgi:hypothetical protein